MKPLKVLGWLALGSLTFIFGMSAYTTFFDRDIRTPNKTSVAMADQMNCNDSLSHLQRAVYNGLSSTTRRELDFAPTCRTKKQILDSLAGISPDRRDELFAFLLDHAKSHPES